jgi:hypothetical protein
LASYPRTHKIQNYFPCLQTLHFNQPSYLADLLLSHDSHRTLRSSVRRLLHVPLIKSSQGRSSFSYAAPFIWNNLTDEYYYALLLLLLLFLIISRLIFFHLCLFTSLLTGFTDFWQLFLAATSLVILHGWAVCLYLEVVGASPKFIFWWRNGRYAWLIDWLIEIDHKMFSEDFSSLCRSRVINKNCRHLGTAAILEGNDIATWNKLEWSRSRP